MAAMITVGEAQAHPGGLTSKLAPGEAIVITDDNNPVAKLVGRPSPKSPLRPPSGLGKGMITIVADDDDHLKGFAESMP